MIRSSSVPSLRRHLSSSSSSTAVLGWLQSTSNNGLIEVDTNVRRTVRLTDAELHAIRQLQHPPHAVRRLLEAVYWILSTSRLNGKPPRKNVEWEKIQRLLGSPGFSDAIWQYRASSLRSAPLVMQHLRLNYFGVGALGGTLQQSAVKRASLSAGALYDWAFRVFDEAEHESRVVTPQAESEKSSARAPSPAAPIVAEPIPEPRAPEPPAPPLHTPKAVEKKMDVFKPLVLTERIPPSIKPLVLTSSKSEPTLARQSPKPLPPKVFLVAVGVCRKTSLIIVRKLLDQPQQPIVVLTVHGQLECTAVKMEMRTVLMDSANRFEVERLDIDNPRNTWDCACEIMSRYGKFAGLVIDAKSFKDVRRTKLPCQSHSVSWACSAVFAVFDALYSHLVANAHVAVLSSQLGVASTQKMSDSQRSLLLQRQGLPLEDIMQVADQFISEKAAASRRGAPQPSGNSWVALDAEGLSYILLHALVLALHHRNQAFSIYAVAVMTGSNLDAEEARAIANLIAKPSLGLGGHLFGNSGAPVPWTADGYKNCIAWSETSSALKRAATYSLQ